MLLRHGVLIKGSELILLAKLTIRRVPTISYLKTHITGLLSSLSLDSDVTDPIRHILANKSMQCGHLAVKFHSTMAIHF